MKTMINIKTDVLIKNHAKQVAGNLGLSLSSVINAFLKQFIRDQAVTFSLTSNMTSELEKILEPIEQDILVGKNISSAISTVQGIEDHFASL